MTTMAAATAMARERGKVKPKRKFQTKFHHPRGPALGAAGRSNATAVVVPGGAAASTALRVVLGAAAVC